MNLVYKICNNQNCGQVLGCMPKYSQCKHCGSKTYDTVKGVAHFYFNPYGPRTQIGIIDYLGSHCHIVHRPNREFDMYVMANDEDLDRRESGVGGIYNFG